MEIIPLFKSHYSIGKSIFTIDQILSIAKESKLKKVFLIEDTLIGFPEADKKFSDEDIQLIFGLRINFLNSIPKESEPIDKLLSKVIILAKDSEGCKLLNKIYSIAFTKNDGFIDHDGLKSIWQDSHLILAIPFYDSFIFNNTLKFCSCTPHFSFCSPIFFIENNLLPFESIVLNSVQNYCEKNNLNMQNVKSIYYETRDDFESYQTYKCICQRKAGKQKTLSIPNFDHLASREFSWESYCEL